MRLIEPRSADEWREGRTLVEEYAASLAIDLSFQNFAEELEHLAREYSPPTGAFLLAEEDGAWLGCVGLRPLAPGTGEIKRLYVSPRGRGRGAGRRLAEAIVTRAKELGYERLRLDTLPDMKAAQALYVSLGFTPIAPYRFNPVPGTEYLELRLSAAVR